MVNYDPYGDGGGNANIRNFPDGSLRTLRKGGDPANVTDWVIIGVAPTKTSASAPNIDYTPDGRAFYWDMSYGRSPVRQYVPDLDDPTKASGYVRPSQAAPRAPSFQVGDTGDIYMIDPYTGAVTVTGNAPGLAKRPNYQITPDPSTGRLIAIDPTNPTNRVDLGAFGFKDYSPQEKRAFQLQDTASERAYRSGESAIDRAIRASEFAATFNAGEAARKADIEARNQQMAFAAEQDYQNRLTQYANDQTQRARQFADLISATDPGALPAFIAAGGGNIGNALAAGATAQTDTANLGAAKTLRAIRETPQPTKFSFSPIAYTPTTFTGITIPSAATAPATSAAPVAAPAPSGGGFDQATNNAAIVNAAKSMGIATPGFAMGTHMPGYADGTTDFIPAPPAFRVGDSPTGMPTGREETVQVDDPEGNARVRVTPDNVMLPDEQMAGMGGMSGGMDDMGEHGGGKFRLFGDVLKAVGAYLTDDAAPSIPRFALGTYTGTMADDLVSAGDEPYLGEVRQIRNSVQYPDFNPYDTSFVNQLPTLQQRFFAGRQTKYGVPVQDQMAEEQRYRLQGANRGAFSLGV